MEVQVHERESSGAVYEVLAVVGTSAEALGKRAVDCSTLGFSHQPLVRTNEKPTGTASRIRNSEVLMRSRIGFHTTNNRLNENARCEILAGSLLAFARRFF